LFTPGSDEADYWFYDLSLGCEPLEVEYDDCMTYFEDFFKKKTQYNSDLVFPVMNPNRISSKTSRRRFVISKA
jgi:hypothetical protein